MLKLMLPSLPEGRPPKVLLHACCAPCSSAIVECLLAHELHPTVYFCNPNIFPLSEYELRKQELIRFLEMQSVPFVEDDYDHERWSHCMFGLEEEPERGRRCSLCFEYRLRQAAAYAAEHGFTLLTTTLASSRWKNLEQINQAGLKAVSSYPSVTFWPQNWRKGGLQERRNELLKLNAFYKQQYCGCEYSMRSR